MRTLLIVLCVAASAVAQEDYRWRILGDKGEEFIVTLYGTTPYVNMPDPGVSGYNIESSDIQFSVPYPIGMGGLELNSGAVFDFVYQFDGTNQVDTQLIIIPSERTDLVFSFYGTTTYPEANNFDGSLAGWPQITWLLTVNTFPVERHSGNILSVSRIPVPEPTGFTCAALGGLLCLRRPRNRDKERQSCVRY
ncbi:MAG: hypothetical protein R3E01_02715 [Pirellulaceae bacterium]